MLGLARFSSGDSFCALEVAYMADDGIDLCFRYAWYCGHVAKVPVMRHYSVIDRVVE